MQICKFLQRVVDGKANIPSHVVAGENIHIARPIDKGKGMLIQRLNPGPEFVLGRDRVSLVSELANLRAGGKATLPELVENLVRIDQICNPTLYYQISIISSLTNGCP